MAVSGKGRRLIAEINVVPYIDVMLVLLVIFMITAPLLVQGIKVELPRAASEPLPLQSSKDEPPLVLSIDRAGKMYLSVGAQPRAALDRLTLTARAAAVLRRSPTVAVLVQADRRVSYGAVIDGMLLLQQAGARKIGFVTEPPSERSGEQ